MVLSLLAAALTGATAGVLLTRWTRTRAAGDAAAPNTGALAELRRADERHQLVSEISGSMIFDHDLVRDVIYRSEALGSVFRWSAHEPTCAWWVARVHPDDVERVRQVWTDAGGAQGEGRWTVEYRWRRGDDVWISVLERGAVVRDDSGTPVRRVGTVTDISDRNELAARLRQSQKMEAVGQLAGGIAHDFNNLLTAIGCNVELLLDALAENDARRDDVIQIREAAGRAAALTHQLLAFSRRQVLQPRPLDLNATVATIERLLRRVISTDVRLHTALDPQLSPVFADAGQMEQVIMNLVINARDAMLGGGTIIVGTSNVVLGTSLTHRFGMVPPGHYVALTVRDTGSGIAPPVLERIFEPFFTTKQLGKGTGLGLATVHGIVLQSNGYLTVDTVLGRGTEFTAYLPALREHVAPAQREIAEVAPASSVERTVIVVDDEQAVRDVAVRALARARYRVFGAASGEDALSLLGEQVVPSAETPSILVLTDVMMPEMNGLELSERIGERFPAVRVATMSGIATEEMARRGLAPPVPRLLAKPFTLPGLLSFVDESFEAGVNVRSERSA